MSDKINWAFEKVVKEKVVEAAEECFEVIKRKAKELDDIDEETDCEEGEATWRFAGRVMNMLFTSFYKPCIDACYIDEVKRIRDQTEGKDNAGPA